MAKVVNCEWCSKEIDKPAATVGFSKLPVCSDECKAELEAEMAEGQDLNDY